MRRIAICDDDQNSVYNLCKQIEKFANEMNTEIIIEEYTSGNNLLFYWEDPKLYADILYLDIHMPGTSGIDVAEQLRKAGCNSEIIFYTKSPIEVFDAFDVDALHYILKDKTPIEKQKEIFKRALQVSEGRREEFITFKFGCEHRTIKIDDIKYFTVYYKVVTAYYGDGKTFDFYSNLDKVSNSLVREGFLRIHRGMLINMAYVDKRSKGDVLMKDGQRFPIGKMYREDAAKTLAYYFRETDEI